MRVLRLTAMGLFGLILIGAIASIGVVTPRTIRVTGPAGTPAVAWAAYHYEGNRFNFADAIAYTRTGAVIRSSADGMLRLPGKIYLRFPLDGWLQPRIDLLYVPVLHSAVSYPLKADAIPRIFDRGDNGRTLRLANLDGDPESWARSLEFLFSFVRHDLLDAGSRNVVADRQSIDSLAREIIADYRAFVARHADTPRTMPTVGMAHLQYAPAAEREATLARIREDLAREPFWGPHVERAWSDRVSKLERMIGG